MLLNDSPFIHLLGLSETRFGARFSDESLSIPDYTIIRRDAADRGHTGVALYSHQSIKTFTKRRNDLESEKVGRDRTRSQTPYISSMAVIRNYQGYETS